MKTLSPTLTACIVVGASFLVWIGGISLAMVHFLGLSSTAGWILVASLGASFLLAMAFIIHEMMNAAELPDGSNQLELDGVPVPNHWQPSVSGGAVAASVPKAMTPSFRMPGDFL